MPGVLRTRAGYCGGTSKDPTYRNIGDHAETLQIDYDPEKISYKDLLKVFWSAHNPCYKGSRQYMSAIFFHNDDQKKLALESQKAEAANRKDKIATEISALGTFTIAEDYHQKYYLRGNADFIKEFKAMFKDEKALLNSTAAARVNAYLDGKGKRADLEKEIDSYGLSADLKKKLLERVGKN